MYAQIRALNATLAQEYANRLVEECVISRGEVDSMVAEIASHFDQEHKKS